MDPTSSLLLDNQLCFALYAATRAMMRAYAPALEKLGLTYPQYLVLLVLWEQAPVTVKSLGDRLDLDSGTLSPLLKRLEQQGLVRRERTKEDERVVQVHLTRAGEKLRAEVEDLPLTVACSIGLTPEHLARMRSDIRGLLHSLRSLEPSRSHR